MARLSSSNAETRAAAEKRLDETPRDSVNPALEPLLWEGKAPPDARAAAIRIILHKAWDGLPAAVVQGVRDPDIGVRHAAIDAVEEIADPRHRGVVEDALANTTDPVRKKELEEALSVLQAREHFWWARQLKLANDPIDRALAARRLGSCGKETDVALLKAAFESADDPHIKQEALIAISEIGGAAAMEFVRLQLLSEDVQVRAVATFCEIGLKDPEAVPTLVQRAGEVAGDTRISAIRALAAIGGADAKAGIEHGCGGVQKDWRVKSECKLARAATAKAH